MSADSRSSANVFGSFALERHAELRHDVEWLAAQLADSHARFLVIRHDGHALAETGVAALRLLDSAERSDLAPGLAPSYLGTDEAGPYFFLQADREHAERIAAGCAGGFLDLRSAGLSLHAFQAGLFAYARALAHWHSRARYCSACAASLRFDCAGHRATCSNARCAIEYFPRVDPAVIMMVVHGSACLLGRQATWPERRYSTLAGFVEPGEALEDAVRREVLEEAGVQVVSCDYHSSQPWPFPASLMVGFNAQADTRDIRLGPELSDARWFEVDDLARSIESGDLRVSAPLSVSYRLIEDWLRGVAGLELADLVTGVG
ncbi:MAG: NAD(+) diphosphatase [Rhodanobacteraceae bacterium]